MVNFWHGIRMQGINVINEHPFQGAPPPRWGRWGNPRGEGEEICPDCWRLNAMLVLGFNCILSFVTKVNVFWKRLLPCWKRLVNLSKDLRGQILYRLEQSAHNLQNAKLKKAKKISNMHPNSLQCPCQTFKGWIYL